jgi:phage tail tape-measure protein
MATLGTLAVNVVANTAGVEKGMARARSAVSSIKTPIKDAIGSLLNFKNAMAGIAAGVVVGGIVKLTAESETLKTRLTTLTGSAETAGKVFKDLKTFAAKTPFDVADIAAAANKLLAFGVSSSIVQERLKMLGDIASGSGSSLSEISSIFGKMKSSGVVALGDLNQLGDRGIPIIVAFRSWKR